MKDDITATSATFAFAQDGDEQINAVHRRLRDFKQRVAVQVERERIVLRTRTELGEQRFYWRCDGSEPAAAVRVSPRVLRMTYPTPPLFSNHARPNSSAL